MLKGWFLLPATTRPRICCELAMSSRFVGGCCGAATSEDCFKYCRYRIEFSGGKPHRVRPLRTWHERLVLRQGH